VENLAKATSDPGYSREWAKAILQFLTVLAALPLALAGGKSDSKVVFGG